MHFVIRCPKLITFVFMMLYSIDAVSDRDFVLEILSTNSIAAVHLSRLGEEWVLWASEEFGFLTPNSYKFPFFCWGFQELTNCMANFGFAWDMYGDW
ncbi:hypothetical protein IFM89_029043 [Coptis chinensis]|uniref:Uncharacterized protein n=1 Tax=Coptis chinensis TaxID=261450 RepID=A0A835M4N0_9MAGN|nr:hypothetical protein IFM89_029043 [Coptis chinensis]